MPRVPLDVPHYTGWRPRSMRAGRTSSESTKGTQRNAKRTRLSKSRGDRALYKSAKGCKHPRYAALCVIADKINGRR